MSIGGIAMMVIAMIQAVQFFFHIWEKKNHQSKYGEYVFQLLHFTKISGILELKN
jgi:hypothetical protein